MDVWRCSRRCYNLWKCNNLRKLSKIRKCDRIHTNFYYKGEFFVSSPCPNIVLHKTYNFHGKVTKKYPEFSFFLWKMAIFTCFLREIWPLKLKWLKIGKGGHKKPYIKWYVSTNNYSKNMVWKCFHVGNSKKFCQHVVSPGWTIKCTQYIGRPMIDVT